MQTDIFFLNHFFQEKFFHLYYDVSIPWKAYKDLNNVTRPTLFLKKTARAIWNTNELKNRAVDVGKTLQDLIDRSPRRPLTPAKKAALKSKLNIIK